MGTRTSTFARVEGWKLRLLRLPMAEQVRTTRSRRLVVTIVIAALANGIAACSGSSSTSSGSSTFTVWDPYPQYGANDAWTKLVEKCGTASGVTVKRTGYDTTDLTNKALLAAQQDNSPTSSLSITRWFPHWPRPVR